MTPSRRGGLLGRPPPGQPAGWPGGGGLPNSRAKFAGWFAATSKDLGPSNPLITNLAHER